MYKVTKILLFFAVWQACLFSTSWSVVTGLSECEKRAHTSFNAAQKQQLCSMSPTSIGPVVCASIAKNLLHVPFEVILQLCMNAESASPAHCMNALDKTIRNTYGLSLCINATSTLPAQCYSKLQSLQAGNQLKPDRMVTFCSSIDSHSALSCIEATKNTSLVKIDNALDICRESVDHSEPNQPSINEGMIRCIEEMKPHTKGSLGLSGQAVLEFCVGVNPADWMKTPIELLSTNPNQEKTKSKSDKSAPAQCYLHAAQSKSGLTGSVGSATMSAFLSPQQRLSLCHNAPTAMGPVNCSQAAMKKTSASDPTTKLQPSDLVDLCVGAWGSGPADCLLESRGLGSIGERTHLCNGAFNSGPAKCYRRSASVLKKDVQNRYLLCVSATTDDPAVCAAAAPHYLTIEEKIHLCAAAPAGRANEPVTCLQAVQPDTRKFALAPKKCLGYFLDNLQLESERRSRDLLINMCSAGGSVQPLAAAECFKSAPTSLNHDDAVRTCTNISSTEVLEHIQFCHKIVPQQWPSESAAVLCEHSTSRDQVEAAVKCAMEALNFIFPRLTVTQAAQLCWQETADSIVLNCAKRVSKVPASASSSYLISAQSLIDTCSLEPNSDTGECFSKLASYSSSRVIFDRTVPQVLCKLHQPMTRFSCIEKQNSRLITPDDVLLCANEKPSVGSVRIQRIYTVDNEITVTAGRQFQVWFEVLDKWNQRFIPTTEQQEKEVISFSVALNNNNPQGAILWGQRLNHTNNGLLQFNNLVISQPGMVDFRIFYRIIELDENKRPMNEVGTPILLDSFRMNVKIDPTIAKATPCLYVFQDAWCPIEVPEADWLSEFPKIRTYSPSSRYLQNLACAVSTTSVIEDKDRNGTILNSWYVDGWVGLDGSMWAEYRIGIASIWTGIGMPRMEMSYEERLGVSPEDLSLKVLDPSKTTEDSGKSKRAVGRAQQKELRRAYYRMSLVWHPDRWVGMEKYLPAAQGAFELVHEAYQKLVEANEKALEEELMNSMEPVFG